MTPTPAPVLAPAPPAETALERRLAELRIEWRRGEERRRLLSREQEQLHATMLRIAGAIQVLEELCEPASGAPIA